MSLTILAFIAAIAGAFAFKPAATHLNVNESWFAYNGGAYDDPGSYTMISAPTGCDDVEQLCAIKDVVVNGNEPQLDASFVSRIEQAVNNHQPVSDQILLKQ